MQTAFILFLITLPTFAASPTFITEEEIENTANLTEFKDSTITVKHLSTSVQVYSSTDQEHYCIVDIEKSGEKLTLYSHGKACIALAQQIKGKTEFKAHFAKKKGYGKLPKTFYWLYDVK